MSTLSQEHVIIESKPDNRVEDLRLHIPWPELQRYKIVKITSDDSLIEGDAYSCWKCVFIFCLCST